MYVLTVCVWLGGMGGRIMGGDWGASVYVRAPVRCRKGLFGLEH